MKSEKSARFIRWGTYILFTFLLFLLQQTPYMLPTIYGVKPHLLLPFVVCVSLFENDVFAVALSVFAGLLWDVSSMRPFGFSALILMILSLTVYCLISFLIRRHFFTGLFFCIAAIGIFEIADWFFFMYLKGWDPSFHLFITLTVPTILYTAAFSLPFYPLAKWLRLKLNPSAD